MKKSAIALILFLISFYSFGQISFSAKSYDEVSNNIKSILKEKNNLSFKSLSILNIVNNKNLESTPYSGVYLVNTDVFHYGDYLLFKNESAYTFFSRIPNIEVLFEEILKNKGIRSSRKKYLKKIYSYYINFLNEKHKSEILIFPKDSSSDINLYKKKKRNKYLNMKKNAKDKYSEYLEFLKKDS